MCAAVATFWPGPFNLTITFNNYQRPHIALERRIGMIRLQLHTRTFVTPPIFAVSGLILHLHLNAAAIDP